MKYSELKSWLENWISGLNGKVVPLNLGSSISSNAQVTIEACIWQIESTPPADRKDSRPCQANKHHLIKIKQAIENEKFDISEFGYGEFSNFKNVVQNTK